MKLSRAARIILVGAPGQSSFVEGASLLDELSIMSHMPAH